MLTRNSGVGIQEVCLKRKKNFFLFRTRWNISVCISWVRFIWDLHSIIQLGASTCLKINSIIEMKSEVDDGFLNSIKDFWQPLKHIMIKHYLRQVDCNLVLHSSSCIIVVTHIGSSIHSIRLWPAVANHKHSVLVSLSDFFILSLCFSQYFQCLLCFSPVRSVINVFKDTLTLMTCISFPLGTLPSIFRCLFTSKHLEPYRSLPRRTVFLKNCLPIICWTMLYITPLLSLLVTLRPAMQRCTDIRIQMFIH